MESSLLNKLINVNKLTELIVITTIIRITVEEPILFPLARRKFAIINASPGPHFGTLVHFLRANFTTFRELTPDTPFRY